MSDVAFVTGVSRGLGAALAEGLIAAGWRVVGIGRSAAPALAGRAFELVHADLGNLPGALAPVAAAMQAAAGGSGRALLVNNAAVAGPVGLLGTLADDDLLRALTVNLAAPVALANAFCAAFADTARERRIINVTSGLAGRAMAGASLYSIAKCGMEMLTRALTVEHGEETFRAVTLRPGIIDTEMQQYLRSRPADALPDVDVFADFHSSGQLVDAATVARKTLARLVDAGVEAGRTYNYAEL